MTFVSQTPKIERRWLRAALLLLILATFGWRVRHLDFQSLWRDEVDAVWFAMRDLPQTLSMFVSSGQNGPLYFLSLRPWLSIVGSGEFALRFPSAFFGTLAIPLLWQVARYLLSGNRRRPKLSTAWPNDSDRTGDTIDWIAFAAALLFSANPYQLWYSQEGKMYAIITALALLATWHWLAGIRVGGWAKWVPYLITVSLTMYSHLLMILIIPLHLLWFLIAWPQAKRHILGYGLALCGLTLPYLPMVWWQWGLLMAQDKRTGFTFTPLPEMLRTLGFNYSFGFAPHTDLVWLSPLIFLAFAGLLLGWEAIGSPNKVAALNSEKSFVESGLSAFTRYFLIVSWFAVPVLEIYILSLRQPVYTDRYIIWITPALAILLAIGAYSIYSLFGRLGLPVALLLLVYIAGFWSYKDWQQTTTILKFDLRAAVHYVSQQRTATSLLILQIPHTEWAYRYYSSDQGSDPFAGSDLRLGRWVGGPWTNTGSNDTDAAYEVDLYLQQATVGIDEIWVIFSEATMWDSRQLLDKWLEKNQHQTETKDFYGVQVRHYQALP